MNDIQHKLFDLLRDLDGICSREGIRYYLCEETALAAYVKGGFFNSCLQASVAMAPKDVLRFIEAVSKEKRPDRITDSMFSNNKYPDFTVRYGDPNSLMLKLPLHETPEKPMVAVTIHMIRYQPKRLVGIGNYIKKFWKACCKPAATVGGTLHHTAVAICNGIQHIGGTAFSRMLFKLWATMHQNRKGVKRSAINSDLFHYSSKLSASESKICFEGKEFSTFANLPAYLEETYGENYKTKTPSYIIPAPNLLISANISWETYQKRLHEEMDVAALELQQEVYNKLQRKVSVYNRKIDHYYAVVARTEKRFAMYEKYMPMKEQLLQLDKEGRYDELNDLLKPYRSALRACYKKKLGLCFDKDIFEITMKLLQKEGRTAYAAKLRALVPEEHWKPMVITNHKGEPV